MCEELYLQSHMKNTLKDSEFFPSLSRNSIRPVCPCQFISGHPYAVECEESNLRKSLIL